MAKEIDHLLLLDRSRIELEVDGVPTHTRDSGKLFPGEVVMLENRRLSTRCPCPHDKGALGQSAFIDEYYGLAFPFGVFFSAGQVFRFHSAIFCSSRSMARFVGRWQVQPMP